MSFDDDAKTWDDNPERHKRAKVLASEIKKYFRNIPISNAFEYGCGTGLVSFYLKDFFKQIMLADNSVGMLEVLKEKIKKEKLSNFKTIKVDLLSENLNLKFDVIYTLMTLHHITDINTIINKYNSLLNYPGYLCIADLEKEDGSFHSDSKTFKGHYGFEKIELEKILNKNNLKTIYYKTFYTIDKQKEKGEIKRYPLFLMIAEKIN